MEKKSINNKERKFGEKVDFSSLYQKNRIKVILHFVIIIWAVISAISLGLIDNGIFGENRNSHSGQHEHSSSCSHTDVISSTVVQVNNEKNNSSQKSAPTEESDKDYGKYLPFRNYWKKYLLSDDIERDQFTAIVLSLIVIRSLYNYLSSLLEKDIVSDSFFHLKSILLNKLWKLGVEQKKLSVNELRALLESEVGTVSELWEHLPSHLFRSILTILIFGTERIINLKNTSSNSLFSFLFLNVIYFLIYNKLSNDSTRKYEIYRESATEELAEVEKQISNAQLIENMGLSTYYEDLRNDRSKKALVLEKDLDKNYSFLSSIISFLPDFYRYAILLFIGRDLPINIVHAGMVPLFLISEAFRDILDCYKEYGKYKIACSKIENFLDIPEREENLNKESIVGLEIEEILFVNVDFKYTPNKNMVLKKYSRKFSKGTINKVVGNNGFGKSTILHLILGIIKPLKGKVFIKFIGGKIVNLHEEINLREWREKIAVYVSHDNLVESGSTGQRQFENISKTLDQREDSQIFIFDESANALDSEKQIMVTEKIEKIVKKNKIAILVQHKTNLTTN